MADCASFAAASAPCEAAKGYVADVCDDAAQWFLEAAGGAPNRYHIRMAVSRGCFSCESLPARACLSQQHALCCGLLIMVCSRCKGRCQSSLSASLHRDKLCTC
jgi:hypothetical protein